MSLRGLFFNSQATDAAAKSSSDLGLNRFGWASNKAEQDYNFIVDIDSFLSLLRRQKHNPDDIDVIDCVWPVHFNKELHQQISDEIGNLTGQQRLDQKSLTVDQQKHMFNFIDTLLSKTENKDQIKAVVSVMGLFNHGKSHLINRLAGVQLPSDRKLHTKGLSFLMANTEFGSSYIFMDMAGSASPMEGVRESNAQQSMADKRAIELFLNEIANLMSDVLIIVVNELTWLDQQLIMSIESRIKLHQEINGNVGKPHAPIIVIHNYQAVRDIDTLKSMWQQYTVGSYYGNQSFKKMSSEGQRSAAAPESVDFTAKVPYFIEENYGTTHFFYCQEGSQAGLKYNDEVLTAIREQINHYALKPRKNVLLKLKESMNMAVASYLKDAASDGISFDVQISTQPFYGPSVPDNAISEIEKASKPKVSAGRERTADEAEKSWLFDSKANRVQQQHFRKLVIDSAPLLLRISGKDLSLKSSSVHFQGYTLILRAPEQEFSPTYDVFLDEQENMVVIMDLPGVEPSHVRCFVAKGNLTICGFRRLTYFDLEENGKVTERVYNHGSKDSNLKILLDSEPHCPRAQGKFVATIKLPDPDAFERDILPEDKVMHNGRLKVVLRAAISDFTPFDL